MILAMIEQPSLSHQLIHMQYRHQCMACNQSIIIVESLPIFDVHLHLHAEDCA